MNGWMEGVEEDGCDGEDEVEGGNEGVRWEWMDG